MQGRDKVVCSYLVACHAALLLPFIIPSGVILFASSPGLLPYYFNTNGNSSAVTWGNGTSLETFQVVLLLIDSSWLVISTFQNVFTLLIISIPFLGVKLALCSLRTLEQMPSGVGLDQRKLYVELEVLGGLLDDLIRPLSPFIYLIGLFISVCCNVLIVVSLLRSSELGDRYPVALTCLIAWSSGITLGGFGALRLTASIRDESLQVLEAVRQEVLTKGVGAVGKKDVVSSRNRVTSENIATARTFARRRPLQLHMGHFRVLCGPGDDIGFGLSILENTFNPKVGSLRRYRAYI